MSRTSADEHEDIYIVGNDTEKNEKSASSVRTLSRIRNRSLAMAGASSSPAGPAIARAGQARLEETPNLCTKACRGSRNTYK